MGICGAALATVIAQFLSFSFLLISLLPMMIVLPLTFGLWGVFAAFPVADFLSTLVTGLWLWKDVRGLVVSARDETVPDPPLITPAAAT